MTEWASNMVSDNDGRPEPYDADLLARCRRGEREAFGLLVGKYQDRVYNAIHRLCGNPDDAEELCQEAFVKALQSLESFRQASGFYTWLFRIAVNLAISHRRRGGRVRFHSLEQRPDADEPSPAEQLPDHRQAGPAEAAMQADTNRQVLKALESLDEESRATIVLRDIEDLSYEEIAGILNVPVGTVKSRLFRARGQMRTLLGDEVGEMP